ncbi:MAG TPA: GAF domain-containing protein [Blastocatellia bacterium]|nr:GAF domain-containing protein [Blastocatellia bacterium]
MATLPRKTLVQRLLALQRGGEIIAASKTITQTIESAAKHLVESYGAAVARVWKLNEELSELDLSVDAHAPHINSASQKQIETGSGRAGRVAVARKAEVSSLLVESPALYDPADPQRYGLCAYAGFPLLFEDRLYGVLELYLSEPSVAEEIEPLATFANQLSANLAKLSASEAAVTEHARASILLKLDSLIDATNDIDTILQTAAEEIGRNLKLDASLVQLWSLGGEEISEAMNDWMPFSHQYTGSEMGQELMLTPALQNRYLKPRGIAREILTSRQPVIIEDVRNNPHGLLRQLAARKSLAAICVVPIVHRQAVIGAIELYRCRKPHAWTTGELTEARQAASAIAIAAHMAQLELAARKSSLIEAVFGGSYGLSFDQILDSVAASMQARAKAELAGLYYGKVADQIVQLKLHGPNKAATLVELNLSLLTDLRQAIESGHPYAISDTTQHPATQGLGERIGALLAVPLRNDEETVGFAIVAQQKIRNWNTSDVVGVSALVESLGMALGKLKTNVIKSMPSVVMKEVGGNTNTVVEHLAEELQITELADQIFAAVREAVDIEGVLKVAVDKLGEKLNAHRCYAVAMPAEQPFTGVVLHGSVSAEYLDKGAKALQQLPIEGPSVEEVTRSLNSVRIDDCAVSALTRNDAKRLAQHGIRALLLSPIVFNNQVNGLIAVHSNEPRQWSAKSLNLLTRAADAVAIGLKYLTLAGGAEYLAERATAFRYSLRRIYSSFDVDTVLAEATRSAALIFNVDQACLFEVASTLNCIHENDSEQFPGPKTLGLKLETNGNPLLSQPADTPVVFNHIGADLYPVLAKEFARLKVKSAIAAKIANGDDEVLLSLHQCDKPRRWTSEEISIFRDLVQNVQTALDASRRIAEVERRQQQTVEVPKAEIRTEADKTDNGKLSEEDLARLNKDLEEMIYTASHDMQSPLLSIDGYLSHLERELVGYPSPRMAQYLERIKANTTSLQRLINSLLDVSRLRRQTDLSQNVNCAEIVKSLKQELQPRLERIGGTIVVASELPTIKGSRLQLTRVFSNLVNNAINYRDQVRPLRITIDHQDLPEEIVFRVKDNGLGIKSSDFERIFKPLTRLEVNQSDGTGMGLYIVKQIINSHGGRIWVESQEGVGTTFLFAFPFQNSNGSTRFRRVTLRK